MVIFHFSDQIYLNNNSEFQIKMKWMTLWFVDFFWENWLKRNNALLDYRNLSQSVILFEKIREIVNGYIQPNFNEFIPLPFDKLFPLPVSARTRWVSVVEFHDQALSIGKVFGQESTVVKWNYQILSLPLVTVCQEVPILDFQSEFSMSKIIQIFLKKKKNHWRISI